ncbi:MAG TPA: TonB-dependent receptor [Saprospiraceae bacterium]|nr:TonB-dependent receptor [Saprospiraceae bacterium]
MKPIKYTIIVLCLLMVKAMGFSQSSYALSAKIVDRKTGEPLIGAGVEVMSAGALVTGTSTDFDGNYQLDLKAGIYNIVASYVSYQKVEVQGFEISSKKENLLDFILEEESLELNEVVITASKVTNTEAALVTLQRKAFNIQDGLSSQQISKTAVSNAADAMKQTPGAVVENGKYIVMRGLGDRYSISQLNGMTMPSTDPYRNSSSLDLIPSSMIENIITLKTFTPDLPGNFTGGLVNVSTKSFPSRFTLQVGLSGSYNSQTNGINDFLGHGNDAGKKDWLGIDDGGRALPSILLSEENRSQLSQTAYLNARKKESEYNDLRTLLNESSRQLSNVFTPTMKKTPLNHGLNFSVGNSYRFGNNTLGFSLGGNYSNEYAHYENGSVNTYTNNGNSLFTYQELKENKSTETPHLGLLANLAYKIGNNHSVSVNGIYNNDTDIVGRTQYGSFTGQLSSPNAQYNTNSLEFIRRNSQSLQLSGKHFFPGWNDVEILWNVLANKSLQSEPDSRYFAYIQYEEDGETIYGINDAEFRPPFHFFRDLNDNNYESKIDITIPFLTNGKQGSANIIKFGGLYSRSERDFSEYQFQHTRHGGVPSFLSFNAQGGDPQKYFDYANFGVIDTTYDVGGNINRYTIGYHYINQINNKNFYSGTQEIGAAYLMAVYELTSRIKLVAGARLETTNLFVESRDTLLEPSKLDLADLLYSGNVIYKLTEKSNLRLAASRTLARPNMRELAPFEQFDTKNGFFNIGNPGLQRTIIHNYDFRYELYPELGELIAVSAFYKKFNNPILRTFSPTATIPELGYVNIDESEVYGIELELRKSLSFISPKLANLFLTTNLAFIESEYKIPAAELKASQTIDPSYNQTVRPFQSQAPYIVNCILSYSDKDLGWDSALSFNISGRKLYNISLSAVPDVYEKPFPLMNFTLSKRIGSNYQIGFSAKNILNPVLEKNIEYKGQTYVIENNFLGSSIGLSVNYFIK